MFIQKQAKRATPAHPLTERLAAYARQAQQFRASAPINAPDWRKTALSALIPLAAASAVEAQCQGALPAVVLNNGNKVFAFDVDGDGQNDFQASANIFSEGGTGSTRIKLKWFLKPINAQFYMAVTGGNKPFKFGGRTMTRAAPNFNGVGFMGSSNGFQKFGNFAVNGAGNIPIRKGDATTGQPGWIAMRVSASTFYVNGSNLNSVSVNIQVLERGVESLTNNSLNTAKNDDCASMASAVLAVELTNFNAAPNGKHIALNWQTATERDNSGFEIQRSTDGKAFAKVGWLDGNGDTNKAHNYAFTDADVQPNMSYYYRLRQLDHDGTAHFSAVRSAVLKDNNKLTVNKLYPNPVNHADGKATFEATVPKDGEAIVAVFDVRGVLVKQLKQPMIAGANVFTIPVLDVAAGTYFVKMQLGGEVNYQKLVVQ